MSFEGGKEEEEEEEEELFNLACMRLAYLRFSFQRFIVVGFGRAKKRS